MLGRLFSRSFANNIVGSQLYDHQTFYRAFERDLRLCRSEAVVESPFITTRRVDGLLPILQKALDRGVRVVINTKPLYEHDPYLHIEAAESIAKLKALGVEILYTGGHHRKLAVFDRQILWEGSLNILSQNDSCEIMRRIDSEGLANQMLGFIEIRSFL
jgi:hypothetical protein